MMRYVKWTFWGLVVLCLGSFLHYTLPQHDIVRIVGSENRRMDIGENAIFWARADVGLTNSSSRDVFFINAVFPNGKSMEYRNEDTGWGWPPYFKVNSFGLQTAAKELQSTAEQPVWVRVTHYGWRLRLFSVFPNAVSIKRVAGPDASTIPWIAISIVGIFVLILVLLRRMWVQFRERTLDPTIDRIDARRDLAREEARGFWARLTGRRKS